MKGEKDISLKKQQKALKSTRTGRPSLLNTITASAGVGMELGTGRCFTDFSSSELCSATGELG